MIIWLFFQYFNECTFEYMQEIDHFCTNTYLISYIPPTEIKSHFLLVTMLSVNSSSSIGLIRRVIPIASSFFYSTCSLLFWLGCIINIPTGWQNLVAGSDPRDGRLPMESDLSTSPKGISTFHHGNVPNKVLLQVGWETLNGPGSFWKEIIFSWRSHIRPESFAFLLL